MGSRELVGWVRSHHRQLIAGFSLLAAALIVAGYVSTPGAETLDHGEYATRMCHDVLQPLGQVRVTAAGNEDLKRFRDGSAVAPSDRQNAITAFATTADELDQTTLALASFNDRTTMRGAAGQRFQLALTEALDRWSDSYEEARAQIDTLDPDYEHLGSEMADIEVRVSGLTFDDGVADLIGRLQHDMSTSSPECLAAVSSFRVTSGS